MSRHFISFLVSATFVLLNSTAGAQDKDAEASSLVLFPSGVVTDQAFAKGCWVRLFDGVEYRGQQLTLVGPIALSNMQRTGTPWRDWDSMKVGPNAEVTIYIVADFGLPAATLKAGQEVADLTSTTGRFEDINSVKVRCDP